MQEHWKTFNRENGNIAIEIRASGKDVLLATSNGDVPIQQYEGDYSALQ